MPAKYLVLARPTGGAFHVLFLIADDVFARVKDLLSRVDTSAELEVIQFAA